MAKIENNKNTENSNLTKKIGETIHDVVENVKHTIEHPIESSETSIEQVAKDVRKFSWWAKLFLILVSVISILVIALLIFVNLDWTKNKAADYALGFLEKDFGVKISKKSVDINIFGDVTINGLNIKDFKNNDLITAKKLRANSDWFSIITNSRNLKFSTLTLSDANIKVVTYKGDSISNFIRFTDKFDDGKARDPKKTPFQLNSRIIIENSKISIVNQNHDGDEGNWLFAENVNAIVPNLKVIGPNITAKINNFSFKTKRWGKIHEVKTFSADFEITKEILKLNDLTFETNHSLLQGDLVFNLDKKTHWQDFTNKVNWNMNLKRGSQISGDDISYFVTKWDNYSAINLAGKMNGTLNNFVLNDFLLKQNEVALQTKEMKFKNLLKGNFHIFGNQFSANITYPKLREMTPSFVSEKLGNFADVFGKINYKGSADITPQKVYAKGNLVTSIGQAVADITLTEFSTKMPRYKGIINAKDFNVAAITKNNQVGLISGKFDVDGRGFNVNTLELKTKSSITSLQLMGKPVNNIFLDGTLIRKQFNGIIDVNDEQARGKINGKIDFSTPKLFADIKGNIDYLNLNYFGVKGQKTNFKGFVDGKVSFTNINDMNVDANLQNVNLALGNINYNVPNGKIKAFFENGNRIVEVDMPNVVTGKIQGRYNLGDLVGMVQNGIDKILVGNKFVKSYRGQNFTFDFIANQALVNYFEPNAKILNDAKINGSYDGNTNNLVLNADIPSLKYVMTKKEEISQADQLLAQANPNYKLSENPAKKDSAMIENLSLKINTANLDEQIFAKIDRAEYNKNVLKDIILSGRNENNQILHIATNFKLGTLEDEQNETLKSYAVNLNQSVDQNGDYVLKFEPTEIKLNNFTWSVDTSSELNHSITYRKKTGDFLIQNLKFYSENSELLVKNAVFKNAKDFDTDIDVKNVELSKILDLFPSQKNLNLKGIANGNMKIKMTQNDLEPIIDLQVKDIFLSGKNMGNMLISAKNSSIPNVFDINTKIVSAGIIGNNNLEVTGTIDNNTTSPTLNLSADLKDFDLAFVQTFVKNIFSNFRGKATGLVKIDGTLKDINYRGDIALKNFGLKINFSGVDYSFADTTVTLNNSRIFLTEPINIKDGRSNSAATLSTLYLDMSNLSNIGAEVFVRSENLLMLNTSQKDFDLFWGRVYAKGDLFIKFSSGVLKIDAGNDFTPVEILNNSIFTLNSNSTSSVEEFKMLRFLQADKEGVITTIEKKKSGTNMDVFVNLNVDKGTTVNVLVGDNVGDIGVRGTAENLKFRMTRTGNMSLNGKYIVDNGTFLSKAILNREFQITKGSNILWDRDAMNPALDISANYYRTVTNAGEYLSIGSLQPINVLLQTKISRNLKNPDIDFDVLAPDVSSQIREALADKMSSKDEKIKQFGSILVLNSFLVSDINLQNSAVNNSYNIVLKQLGSVFNSISKQFQLDLSYVNGNISTNTSDRANVGGNLKISPRVTFKTSWGIPISKTENTISNYLSGEGIIEYDWSKKNDGTKLFRAYSKPSNISVNAGNTTSNQTYGGGIVWSKNFNTLFKRKKTTVVPTKKENKHEQNKTQNLQKKEEIPTKSIENTLEKDKTIEPKKDTLKKINSKKYSLLRIKG